MIKKLTRGAIIAIAAVMLLDVTGLLEGVSLECVGCLGDILVATYIIQ